MKKIGKIPVILYLNSLFSDLFDFHILGFSKY